jgi:hypothetical protein
MPDHHGMLILIQGLAGAGKSHLIQLLRYDFLIEKNFAASVESEQRNIADLASNLRCGRRCIVSERKYRSNVERGAFINRVLSAVAPSPSPAISIICFENDPETANHNCKFRQNKLYDQSGAGHIAQNNHDTQDYEIPDEAIVVRIHRIASEEGA